MDAEAIAKGLKRAEHKAMLTRDGQGEYSSATMDKLLSKGLIERTLRFTDLGHAVRDVLRGK